MIVKKVLLKEDGKGLEVVGEALKGHGKALMGKWEAVQGDEEH